MTIMKKLRSLGFLGLAAFGYLLTAPMLAQSHPGSSHTNPSTSFCRRQRLMDFGSLHRRVRDALARCGEPGDQSEQAACGVLHGLRLLANGQKALAFARFEDTLAMYEEQEDHWAAWFVHYLMGTSIQSAGDYTLAESHYLRALEHLATLDTSRELPPRSFRLFGEILQAPAVALYVMVTTPARRRTTHAPRTTWSAGGRSHYASKRPDCAEVFRGDGPG